MGLFSGIKKIAGGLLGGISGGDLLTAGLSFFGGERANDASAYQAQLNRQYQERLSSTAHQREVKDLRAAGLNPILSAKYGGSSTPGGNMPVMRDTITPALSSARESARLSPQNALLRQQQKLAEAQTNSAQSTAAINAVDANIATSPEGRALRIKKYMVFFLPLYLQLLKLFVRKIRRNPSRRQ